MKKKSIFVLIIVFFILSVSVIVRPYNNVETNAAVIYYQSYILMKKNISQYASTLENYISTKDEKYIDKAISEIDGIKDLIIIFRIANQSEYRNTFINQRVKKTPYFVENRLDDIELVFEYSENYLLNYKDNKSFNLEDIKYMKDCSKEVYNALNSAEVGYNEETKEYLVVLNKEKEGNLIQSVEKIKVFFEEKMHKIVIISLNI